jgi:hypothetical protein
MYMIALALGAGLGNMVGGALQSSVWAVQVGVMCALAAATIVFCAAINMHMLVGQQEKVTEPEQQSPIP